MLSFSQLSKSGARCKVHLALLFVFATALANAQTIRPVRSEYRMQANGSFELVNDTFTPVNIILEAQSFDVTETGEIRYRKLDPSIHVKFSTPSFRIQPKQTYTVFYKATADKLPAWFVIYAGYSNLPLRSGTGMNVVLKLPHTVYILPKKDATKAEIKVVRSEFNSQTKKLFLELHSNSANFARVLAVQVAGGKGLEDGGFPMYPGGTRRVEVDWKDSQPPTKVAFRFENYRIESPITPK